MRVLLLGAGEFGVPTFDHLREHHDIAALISQPDRPAGRNRQLTPAPAAQWAQDHHLPVLKSHDVNTPDFVAQVAALKPQVTVVIAFGQKLSPQLLAVTGKLTVNLHSSLLPRFRGAAPINWAILAGEKQTGVSVISLAQQMDAGLIYAQLSTPIDPLETAGELHDRLALLGPLAIGQVIEEMAAGRLQGRPQDVSQATRAPKLSKADSPLDFSLDAAVVRCRVHGLTPWPGASALWHRKGQPQPQQLLLRRVQIATAAGLLAPPGTILADGTIACGSGSIRLLELQLPGKRMMSMDEFARGNPLLPGDRLAMG